MKEGSLYADDDEGCEKDEPTALTMGNLETNNFMPKAEWNEPGTLESCDTVYINLPSGTFAIEFLLTLLMNVRR